MFEPPPIPVTLSFPAAMKWAGVFLAAQWVNIPIHSREALQTLMLLMLVDLATGLWAAILEGKLTSESGARGISVKVATIFMLLFSHYLEKSIGLELNMEMAGALGYSLNEAISVLENLARIGVPIPGQLVDALLKVKKLRPRSATPEELKELHDSKGE